MKERERKIGKKQNRKLLTTINSDAHTHIYPNGSSTLPHMHTNLPTLSSLSLSCANLSNY